MRRQLKRAVKRARKALESDYGDSRAQADLYEAERRLAAAKGWEWAEPVDFGVVWDVGAPLPHLVSNGSRVVLICHASTRKPNWDGSYVTVVSPEDSEPLDLLEFTFEGCHSTKFGGPNDEVLHGHPLYSSGLVAYEPHLIHNSRWIADEEAINSVHEHHKGGWHRSMKHYLFVFHDEIFEALARSVTVEQVHGRLPDRLAQACSSIVNDD